MTDEKRPYRMKARAEQQDDTRRRITESAVALHGSIGPAKTSMSAVAEHAGVRRSTLYRHFPDEGALFVACSRHWAVDHPVPDHTAWVAIENPDERLRRALTELYAYYEGGEAMLANLIRDFDVTDVVREHFSPFLAYLTATRDVLMAGRGSATRRTRAAIGHAIAFGTWRSLSREQGLPQREAVDLMCELVAHSAAAR
jgi:AcrR family transcriptional regulator